MTEKELRGIEEAYKAAKAKATKARKHRRFGVNEDEYQQQETAFADEARLFEILQQAKQDYQKKKARVDEKTYPDIAEQKAELDAHNQGVLYRKQDLAGLRGEYSELNAHAKTIREKLQTVSETGEVMQLEQKYDSLRKRILSLYDEMQTVKSDVQQREKDAREAAQRVKQAYHSAVEKDAKKAMKSLSEVLEIMQKIDRAAKISSLSTNGKVSISNPGEGALQHKVKLVSKMFDKFFQKVEAAK